MIAVGLLGLAAVLTAVGVITARKPVHSVLWLIVHFLAVAAIFLTLTAEFLALIEVLVNAGAIMVLFLFVIGLLGPSKEAPSLRAHLSPGQALLAGCVALVLIGSVALRAPGPAAAPAPAPDFGGVTAVGQALFGPQLVPFELTALVLLVAIVSVVTLAGGAQRP
jgi:NADH-quinone oxidoreductase subunit J